MSSEQGRRASDGDMMGSPIYIASTGAKDSRLKRGTR